MKEEGYVMWKCPKCETMNDAPQCVICGETMPRPVQEPPVYQNTFNQPLQQPYTHNIQQPQTQSYPVGQPVYPTYNMPPEGYYSAPVKKKSKLGLIIALILVAILIVGGVIGAIYFLSDDEVTNTIVEPLYTDNGDTITFGHYEQDNNLTNGKEPIEWIVLEREGDKALIISKYSLDVKPFHNSDEDVKWEDSSLRKWLTNDFFYTAFNSDEIELIQETTIPENYIKEKIFLLNVEEAKKYFDSDKEREAKATEYAKANGVYISDGVEYCWWWLRSSGMDLQTAADVLKDGVVNTRGADVDNNYGTVRPALWIKLK